MRPIVAGGTRARQNREAARGWLAHGHDAARLVVVACVVAAAACSGRPDRPLRVIAEEEHLTRQVTDLRRLVAQAEKGSLVPSDGLVVVVRERLVREVLQRALPLDQPVLGRFHMLMETGDVSLEDGHAVMRLDGRVDWRARRFGFEKNVSADVTVFGRVEVVGADVRGGTLTGRVVPYGFEIHKLLIGEAQPRTRQLMERLGRELPEALSALSTRFTIPVAFERVLRLDGVTAGGVTIPGAEVPVRVTVREATAHGGRLWIHLDVEPQAWRPREEAP